MNARPPVLQLAGATVMKDGVAVLDRVTLTVRAGEHTAIIGPNGAGKSTLIDLLTHDERPVPGGVEGPVPGGDEGPIRGPGAAAPVRVFGVEGWNVFDLRPRLGVVSADLHRRFVNGNSAGPVVARDAVVSRFFGAHGFLVERDVTPEMRGAAAAALARMGVEHLADTPLDRMSTGEARRVLIARALVTSPEALLLDEPTAGLDLVARHRFLESIRDVARRGTTIVLVTHRVEEVIPEIESVVLLRRGRVFAAGPKASTLTAGTLTALFGSPISLTEAGGYYSGATRIVR